MDKTRAIPILASAALAVSLAACQGMGGREASSGAAPSASSAQTSAASASGGRPGMAEPQAAAPDLVRDVQRTLGAKGYDAGAPDGVYGPGTEQALRKFQRDQRLNSTGQIDVQTLAALGLTGEARPSQRAAPGSGYTPTTKRQGAMATPPPDQVRGIQQTLADRGYDPGPTDGRWGPRTQQALRDFQRAENLQASGRPDPQTLAALGVETGSPTTQTGELPAESNTAPPQGDAPMPPPEDSLR